MTCLFPEVSHRTAYSKGCRCEECRSRRQEERAMCSGRPWEERNPGMQKRYPVPAELVLELIESWLEERRNEEADQYESLGQELGIKQSGAMRMVYRLRHKETTYMSFGQADKIISALFGPQHWYTDETLNAIYEEHA